MGASEVRKDWQAFKKANPLFEQSKDTKLDLGPEIDKILKVTAAWYKNEAQAQASVDAFSASLAKINKAFDGYSRAIEQTGNKTLMLRFQKFKAQFRDLEDSFGEIEKARDKYVAALRNLGS